MKYLSLCSGIEAATVAWHSLGWEAVAYSEIEKFPSQVLAHHYPQTPNLGDMTKFKEWSIESNVDLLVGGTPCQSFSVAGLRKGLDDPRGNLMLTYLAIADKYRPRWLVWENVPGVLSSNAGQDFGTFLGGLGELGYGFAYRVLDAQYFGVAQRRRRVFVVGYLGDWRLAAAVLFERHSLSGNPAPSREKREDIAGTIAARFGISRNNHEELAPPKYIGNAEGGAKEVPFLTCHNTGGTAGISNQTPLVIHETVGALCADTHPGSYSGQDAYTGRLIPQPIAYNITFCDANGTRADRPDGGLYVSETDVTSTLTKAGIGTNVAQPTIVHGTQDPCVSDIAFAQGRNNGGENVMVQAMAVRRLTPKECERLQGFGDNYTDIQAKGKPTPDGPRYKALGNSMAVPVMAWIGQRIQEVEAICKQNK
jgi:DNA (cytosine-5)-methyltransferase 1